jgi:hypothetical protein
VFIQALEVTSCVRYPPVVLLLQANADHAFRLLEYAEVLA